MHRLLTLARSLHLFLGIVWREFNGVRLSPWTALKVVRIVYPSPHE
jgi:hypothetical protein